MSEMQTQEKGTTHEMNHVIVVLPDYSWERIINDCKTNAEGTYFQPSCTESDGKLACNKLLLQ